MFDLNLIWLIIGIAAYLAAILSGYMIYGMRGAAIAASIGIAFIFYNLGRKNTKDYYTKETKIIEEKRQDAYKEIDERGTTRDDVLKRLRDNSY